MEEEHNNIQKYSTVKKVFPLSLKNLRLHNQPHQSFVLSLFYIV